MPPATPTAIWPNDSCGVPDASARAAGVRASGGTYEEDDRHEELGAAEDPYPPCEERLHDVRNDSAHDRHAEPRVVVLHEDRLVAIAVHEVVKRDVGYEPRLDPLVDQ